VTRQAGLIDDLWSTSAAWADLDGDGYPDLYVCHYTNWSWDNNPPCRGYADDVRQDICPPKMFKALPHRLYRNNGNGTFADVSREAGLRQDGKGLCVGPCCWRAAPRNPVSRGSASASGAKT
jgi:hypothetical protein